MPLTDKGREILIQMERDHGSTVTVPVVAPVAEASDQAKLDAVMGMCQAYDQKDSAADLSRLKQLRDAANEAGRRARQGMGYSTTTAGFRLQGQVEKKAKKAKAAYQQARDEYARANNLSIDEVIALIKGSRNDEAESTQLDDVMATCDEYEKKDAAGSSQASAAQTKMRQCKSMAEYHKKCSTVNDIRLANAHVKAAQWYQEAYQAYYDAWSWYKDGDLRGGDKAMQVANEYGARANTLSEEL